MKCAVLVLSVLSTSVAAQAPVARSSVLLDAPAGLSVRPSVGSDGNLVAISRPDTGANRIVVTTSDGRGLAWTTDVRIDADTTASQKSGGPRNGNPTCWVAGDSIYAVWQDERHDPALFSQSAVYFNHSVDRGVTWAGEQRIDAGGAIDDTRSFSFFTSPDPLGDHLYLLTAAGPSREDAYLVASHDGGATWGGRVPLNVVGFGTADVDEVGLSANGSVVHTAWVDDRFGSSSTNDVYYRRSADGGATWGTELALDASGPGLEFARCCLVAAEGSLVAVAWQEKYVTTWEMRCRVSSDGGLTFGAEQRVDTYPGGSMGPNGLALAVTAGNVVLAWHDDRSFSNQVYASVSTDAGATWGPNAQVSAVSGKTPAFATNSTDVALTWDDSGFPGPGVGALSRDAGLTWSAPLAITDNVTSSGPRVTCAANAAYDNFVCAWTLGSGALPQVSAGGFRAPTLTPVGFTGGPSTVHFDLDWFGGSDPFGFVVASTAPGTFPLLAFGDARDLGLTFDALFNLTLGNAPLFLATLDGSGSGSTAPFPISLSGLSIYSAAVSFDFLLVPRELTDVVAIPIP